MRLVGTVARRAGALVVVEVGPDRSLNCEIGPRLIGIVIEPGHRVIVADGGRGDWRVIYRARPGEVLERPDPRPDPRKSEPGDDSAVRGLSDRRTSGRFV